MEFFANTTERYSCDRIINTKKEKFVMSKKLDDLFSYKMVTDSDVKRFNAIPGTIKITEIKATEEGVVDIPETINGLPVTFYAGLPYFGDTIKKFVIPKTLVALKETGDFPEIADELIVNEDNPNFSTDGISLLSKDGKKLLRMCQQNRESYEIPDGVTTICVSAFKFNHTLEVTIPDSVTTVEFYAFNFCSSLKYVYGGKNIENCGFHSFSDTAWFKNSPMLILGKVLLRCNSKDKNIVIPEGIESIGYEAFSSERGVFKDGNLYTESITLPSSIREIGEFAFAGMRSLETINFPVGLTAIKRSAFIGCHSLAEVVLSNSISEIGPNVFSGCKSLKKVIIPNAVSGIKTNSATEKRSECGVISEELFKNCVSLESFEIPEGTVAIGDAAFEGCENLKEIRIPDTVKSIGKNALPHATTGYKSKSAKFCGIDVGSTNKAFGSLDGILCSNDKKTLISCPAQYDVTDYTIPEGVNEISPGAFEGCEKIKKITFAQSVEKIGARAFASMTSLEEIVLPKDFPILGEGIFEGCVNLKSITWPDNIQIIGEECFANTGIKKLTIPETVEAIDMRAFARIKAKKVRLPKTVKVILLSVFAGVPEIEVYDTIDFKAKPASEYVDAANGHVNGMVGFIGIYQPDRYMVAACNAHWYEHTIIVRSSKDDSEKYRVRMPMGQKRKVYCTYASSWGKNAKFNFCAIDDIFNDLTPDAKLDYVFNRLHWQEGISEEMLDTLKKYISRNTKAIIVRICKKDTVDELGLFEPFGIIKKNNIDEMIDAATKAKAKKCTAWLLDWQNNNLSAKEKSVKANREKNGKPTVAELKKIWPNKKGADGGLTITGYNGNDIDICVPEIIGKTPVTAIGDDCFWGYKYKKDPEQGEFLETQLRSVEIPDSVVNIGNGAFSFCKALERVRLPKKMSVISCRLFSNCKNLLLEIPEGITEIQSWAFHWCSMKSIKIPASVKAIDNSAFLEMSALTVIEVDPESKYFKSVDGVLFTLDGKTLIKYPDAKALDEYVVPEGVTEISVSAFSYASALKSIVIPETVETIGSFRDCKKLKKISMPEKISKFGDFCGCTSLKEIVVPKGVTELQGGCFEGCKSLKRVVLPKGLKKIQQQAFNECESLCDINIPNSVQNIGDGAFWGCKTLKDIIISRKTIKIGYGVFGDCDNLTIHTLTESPMYAYAKKANIKVKEITEK